MIGRRPFWREVFARMHHDRWDLLIVSNGVVLAFPMLRFTVTFLMGVACGLFFGHKSYTAVLMVMLAFGLSLAIEKSARYWFLGVPLIIVSLGLLIGHGLFALI